MKQGWDHGMRYILITWREPCIKEKIALIRQIDTHQLFPHSWWGTAGLQPNWCAVAAGSSERLKDSIRCMKSFRFSNVESTLNADKLDRSCKLCRKPARFLYLWWQHQPFSVWTAICWGPEMISKCERVRLCPNLSLPGWYFPSSNIQFPLVSPHCLHSLCLQS